ncbi:MAG: hypothetical protein K6F53_11760 [Lachnospiraceae bacterium]|nr:hypothetical protein [Lachnospiraceae bacterium]
MTIDKENKCLSELDAICRKHFGQDEYCLHGPKESAVCMEKRPDGWSVFENERNSRYDDSLFDNIVEAALDFLKRLCKKEDYVQIKDSYLDAIIEQKIA